MSKTGSPSGEKTKHISAQLLLVLVPMIALFIIVVATVLFVKSQSIIVEENRIELQVESAANANSIGSTLSNIKGYYNGLADTLETSVYEDDQAILEALEPGMKEFPDFVIDCYLGLSNMDFYDGGGWVPDADYDPTTRGWYQNGVTTDSVALLPPSVDLTTGQIVACGSRSVKLLDGREGALSIDIVLSGLSEEVQGYTPLDTGKSLLLAGSTVLAAPDASYIGTDVSEHTDDKFLQEVASIASGGETSVQSIRGNDRKSYYVSFVNIPGTDWMLVSYVKESDVLKDLSALMAVTVILEIIMLVVSTLMIIFLIQRMIAAPVTSLTNTITRIADGDFTVTIDRGGNNEIGAMNNHMHDYVEQMRGTLGQMKQVTRDLSAKADTSRAAAENMSSQADAQSSSMVQIHEAMEGVANSVTELADNATNLAQAVDEMSQKGDSARDIMNDLLVRAKKGQQDMETVQSSMETISTSMTQMSSVVQSVDEAAQKINSILEMINSISSQTNLLSLNASIEAARAGEAGKGFAVVAGEIGKLANDSASATTEISQIIGDIASQVKILSERSAASVKDIASSSQSVKVTGETFAEIFTSLDEAGTAVNDMVTKMNKVNDIAMSVAAIAQEQSASTEEVTATVQTAAASAQNVANESRNVDESAVTVAESSAKIGEFVDTFTI